jgi:hypothetical protein
MRDKSGFEMIVNGAQNFNSHQRQVIYLSLVMKTPANLLVFFYCDKCKVSLTGICWLNNVRYQSPKIKSIAFIPTTSLSGKH